MRCGDHAAILPRSRPPAYPTLMSLPGFNSIGFVDVLEPLGTYSRSVIVGDWSLV
jgi:hypothetical protein